MVGLLADTQLPLSQVQRAGPAGRARPQRAAVCPQGGPALSPPSCLTCGPLLGGRLPGTPGASVGISHLLSSVHVFMPVLPTEGGGGGGGQESRAPQAWVARAGVPVLCSRPGLLSGTLTGLSRARSAREAGAGAAGEPLLRPHPPRPRGPARQPHQPDRVPLPPQALLGGGPRREAGAGGR